VTAGRALVTGASGFAGRHLSTQLLDQGWEVAGTFRHREPVAGVHPAQLTLDDIDGLRALVREFNPDVVYHLAALVDTVTTPDIITLYRTNTLGTVTVLEALKAAPSISRVLLASSAFVYGRAKRPDAITETEALTPLTAYGASKVAAEEIGLQWARETGVDIVIARAFQHTGPGHVGRYALSEWAAQISSGTTTVSVGNLDVVRDYLDVRDVVAAYRALVDRGRSGEAYNVASGIPRSMRSMLDGLIDGFGAAVSVTTDPSLFRPVDQPTFVADIHKISQETSWKPRIPMSRCLSDLAAWQQPERPD
jgi:GDP-4-dehydro-6-deoxy-D-mannose reductase